MLRNTISTALGKMSFANAIMITYNTLLTRPRHQKAASFRIAAHRLDIHWTLSSAGTTSKRHSLSSTAKLSPTAEVDLVLSATMTFSPCPCCEALAWAVRKFNLVHRVLQVDRCCQENQTATLKIRLGLQHCFEIFMPQGLNKQCPESLAHLTETRPGKALVLTTLHSVAQSESVFSNNPVTLN